jgi:hypothetical protein
VDVVSFHDETPLHTSAVLISKGIAGRRWIGLGMLKDVRNSLNKASSPYYHAGGRFPLRRAAAAEPRLV